MLYERPLGELPASDVNGDGDEADSLAVLVTQASDGWIVMVDTDGDGSFAGERPIHDYLRGRDTFGWAQPGKPSPMAVAANITTAAGAPTLDLYLRYQRTRDPRGGDRRGQRPLWGGRI